MLDEIDLEPHGLNAVFSILGGNEAAARSGRALKSPGGDPSERARPGSLLGRLGRPSSARTGPPPLDSPAMPGLEVGHRIIFVGGLHRSGTSILARSIAAHPSISAFSNTGVPEDEGQHLQTVFQPAYAYGSPGTFAFNPEARL